MASLIRRDLTAAVLDHAELGDLCVEVLQATCTELQAAGFQTTLSSRTGIEDRAFGTELLCYSRLASLDGETVIALCVRVTCSATSKPALTCIATLELHRDEAPERPKREGGSLLAERALVFLQGPGLAGESEEENCRRRKEAIATALRASLTEPERGKLGSFVEEALAP